MQIRTIIPEDRNYVVSIIVSRWNVSEEEANSEFNRWLINDQNSVCYVGVVNNKLMATAVFDTVRDGDLDISPYNTLLYVEPGHRGNKYGEALSCIRYKWALSLNYKVVFLDTKDAL